ncbi:DUF488 family protein [Microbacterium sp. LWO14-1.2]|uniref:DUF488 domain-containing protein n=1 Tax=Microbacterium sp. LWO14-1.2 TaxID=3135263 RepID=UPI003139998E
MPNILIKHAYDAASTGDGYRVLVDRLWPRGVSKERAALDEWLKDIAPSPDLRTWWNHDPERMAEFAARYDAELEENTTTVQHLLDVVHAHDTVTLIYAAHDPAVNHAVVLQRFIQERMTAAES